MANMSISQARANLSGLVDTSRTEPVFVHDEGLPVAVVVSPLRYDELLEALESIEDVESFDAAMEENAPNVPWDVNKP